MIATVGKPFTFKFTNNSNFDIELRGDIDVSKMFLKFTKHQPYQPPRYQHMGGSKIRIFYDPTIPCHTIFELVFFVAEQAQPASIFSMWKVATPFFKTIIKRSFLSLMIAALFGVAIYGDNKYNEGKIGDWFTPSVWFAEKLSDGEDKVKSIDTRIVTNDHRVYESEGFKEAENLVNKKIDAQVEDLKDDNKLEEAAKLEAERVTLKDEYWFLGEGLFVFRSIVKKGDEPILVNFEVASDFCDMIGARVISVDEYEFMNGLLVYLTSIFSIVDDSNIPEWTRTGTIESGYNKILMKSSDVTPISSMNIRGAITGDVEDTKAAFRCTMDEFDFIGGR